VRSGNAGAPDKLLLFLDLQAKSTSKDKCNMAKTLDEFLKEVRADIVECVRRVDGTVIQEKTRCNVQAFATARTATTRLTTQAVNTIALRVLKSGAQEMMCCGRIFLTNETGSRLRRTTMCKG
jgi:hypothetical protein